MGLEDVFKAEDRFQIKVGVFTTLMDQAVKAKYLENGIKAGVPTEYLKGIVTGEPVEVEFPEAYDGCIGCMRDACDIDFPEEDPDEEVLFLSEEDMFREVAEGSCFVLTAHGYECTPADIRPEREIGKPVKGFERRVPLSWIEKGFVEVLDEHREEPF